MIIKVVAYPATFQFTVDSDLPKFEHGCKTRGEFLLQAMIDLEVVSPSHEYEDYIVENIKRRGANTEIWELGS